MNGAGRTRRQLLRAGVGLASVGIAGCVGGGGAGRTDPSPTASPSPAATPTASPTEGPSAWRETSLTDVRSGESFTIAGFEGRPVLIEFFAVWCPICTRQQVQLRGAVDAVDDLVAISLNTDPNESAEQVRDHLSSYEGFDWRYAVAPPEMVRAFIDDFGSVIANPPSAPVVRVCPDGSASLLESQGVKSTDTLVAALDRC